MKKYIFGLMLVASAGCASSTVWSPSRLQTVKNNISRPYYKASLRHVVERADSLLGVAPLSVVDKDAIPPSGDRHDYMSQARYFWPDPSKADGLPYVNRDGVTNPEIYCLDRNRLGDTADRINTLALAYYLTGDEKYARKATELIRHWFINKSTRMNPNLEYAQMIPGVNGGKGRCYGVLDTYSFVETVGALQLLESSASFTPKDAKAMKQWFGKLVDWMIESEQGQEEARQANNHSTAFDSQLMAFSLYAGRRDLAEKIAKELGEKRVFTQIEPDGRQPHELTRTLAYGYSQYNLTHFLDMLELMDQYGIPAENLVSSDGRSIGKGLDFLAHYVGKDAPEWEYHQISGMEGKKQELLKDLYRWQLLNPEHKDFAEKYFSNRILDYSDPFNLLYLQPREIDDAMVEVIPQLKYAVECATEARNNPDNAAGRKVIPRSIDKDGKLAMIHPHDWCSGFFPGTLWMVYDYTNRPEWRETAISWTWPIEEAKWHKGTHDLGFMMNDSFGKAYELTGEQSYRDVVLRSAKTLSTRYNSTVKSIRSWDHNADKWKFPVIIDNMMNLEMLFRATELTGDSTYYDIAVNHANTTLKNHFREDGSSYHVVDYDPATGDVRMKCTAQGYADDSFWSRGQAWGLYGFAQCYKYTGDRRYLDMSRKIADFFLSLPNMPGDKIPYWDMRMPEVMDTTAENVREDVPRDASAAAILASGLYMLSDFVAPEEGARYCAYADEMVKNLTDSYRIPTGEKYGFILDHSTGHHPAGSEIDVPLNYADYYYIEALGRKK